MKNKDGSKMETNLFWLLVQATVLTKPKLAQISEKYTLTPPQMFTLCMLQPGKPGPMNIVCTSLHCDASNVTGIVDRLVTAGYVKRQELPQDRRVKVLVLTEKGVTTRRKLLQETAAVQLPNEPAFTQTEKQTLQKLLMKLLAS